MNLVRSGVSHMRDGGVFVLDGRICRPAADPWRDGSGDGVRGA